MFICVGLGHFSLCLLFLTDHRRAFSIFFIIFGYFYLFYGPFAEKPCKKCLAHKLESVLGHTLFLMLRAAASSDSAPEWPPGNPCSPAWGCRWPGVARMGRPSGAHAGPCVGRGLWPFNTLTQKGHQSTLFSLLLICCNLFCALTYSVISKCFILGLLCCFLCLCCTVNVTEDVPSYERGGLTVLLVGRLECIFWVGKWAKQGVSILNMQWRWL